MDYLITLLAQGAPDPASATMDWVIDKGLLGGTLLVILALCAVCKQLYSDNQALRDRIEKMQGDHKDEIKVMAGETLTKVEAMQEKQTDLVEKVVEVQADTNATLRSLRVVDRGGTQ